MTKVYKKKNYHRSNKNLNLNKKIKKQKRSANSDFDEKKKKFKYIQRSKESEEAQRRQKNVEDKYRRNELKNFENYSEEINEEKEDNPYEILLSQLNRNKKGKNQGKAIESSSDEESEIEEQLQIESYEGSEDCVLEHFDEAEEENDKGNEETNLNDDDFSSEKDDDFKVGSIISENSAESEDYETDLENENQSSDGSEESLEVEKDPFAMHLDQELSQEHIDNLLQKPSKLKVSSSNWPILGNLKIEISRACVSENHKSLKQKGKKVKILIENEEFATEGKIPLLVKYSTLDLSDHHVKNPIVSNVIESKSNELTISEFQCELFSIFNNYQDLYYPHRNFNNEEEIRYIYCLHVLNHMLKTRSRIIHHNAKLASDKKRKLIPDLYRDQGLIRPKILIVLPFKNSAVKILEVLISLLFGSKSETAKKDGSVRNYKRFEEEFTGDTIKFPKTKPKPEDYEKIFSGNTDDSFRLGISLTKKCIKLYQDFYSSDIIIASPLGLRMIVGAPGDSDRDFDFLNSIEILILDQAELFFAQNWDHLIHVLDHLHLQPQSVQNTDFSRVRQWCLNGLSRFYRQTLLFTSHELPEFRALFNNKCLNYRGKIKVVNLIEIGSIRNVASHVPQIFYKIEATSIQTSFDTRFKYFTTEVLPQFKGSSKAHCMIYVPSYFDFVRLRNYMKLENINFSQICEYTKDGKIARARDMFFHSASHFLLYSERAHFFKRTRIKGIRHLIMYQPPYWPNLYSEMINLMQEGYQNTRDGLDTSMSITVLYTKYDMLQIANIIGTKRAAEILQSGKTTHMFTT